MHRSLGTVRRRLGRRLLQRVHHWSVWRCESSPLLADAARSIGPYSALAGVALLAAAVQAEPCGPVSQPAGANPGEPAIFCTPLHHAPGTYTQGPNWWIDNFSASADPRFDRAEIPAGYRLFESLYGIVKTKAWRYTEPAPPPSVNGAAFGWKSDVVVRPPEQVGGNFIAGGSFLRPDRSFRFEGGQLVFEYYSAAGVTEYGGGAWPEWIVTTGPAPATRPDGQLDNFYAFGAFRGYWTIGCRMHDRRIPICALFSPTERLWEMGFWTDAYYPGLVDGEGGGPFTPATDAAWRECDTSRGDDADHTTTCKDRFKIVLTRDTMTLYANDVEYFRVHMLVPTMQLPDQMLLGEVYTYLANWVHEPHAEPSPEVVRFTWGPFRVNPHLESSAVFADGFESGGTERWGSGREG